MKIISFFKEKLGLYGDEEEPYEYENEAYNNYSSIVKDNQEMVAENLYSLNFNEDEETSRKNSNIYDLLDELEDSIYDSKKIPFISKRIIDEDEILDILDEIKGQLKKPKITDFELLSNNPEIRQAKEFSKVIKTNAKEYVKGLLDNAEEVVKETLIQIQENKKELK